MSRLGRTLSLIVTLMTLPAAGAAQPPGPPPLAAGTGILVGQVIDAATGKGVTSAVVTLAGTRRVMTTPDGQFAFRNLPEGSHSLTAAKVWLHRWCVRNEAAGRDVPAGRAR